MPLCRGRPTATPFGCPPRRSSRSPPRTWPRRWRRSPAGAPLNGIRDIGGPEIFTLDELGRITLSHKGDHRTVVTDPTAGMFGAVKGDVLTDKNAHLAPTRYADWLS